ncbi:MAG: Uma2 family endonuclease [Synechococcales cyanobacterium CRU_2_2]|nr:Uma2 family endonuclease [Synechococcales cyanobacterium CRU_2_2]
MVQQISVSEIFYPDRDGQPMADNTAQFQWIVTIKENLELLYANDPNIFVAGDLLWYPVEGQNKIRQAPDVLVAFTRPKGYRGSYRQWEENGVPPQVVFEILSPGNRRGEMARKLQFYNRYGVEEYYEFDPDSLELIGWERHDGSLEVIEGIEDWISPRLQIRFGVTPETWEIYRPDGSRFLTFVELGQRLATTSQQLSETNQRLEESQAKAARLAARLKELGVDPGEI